MNNPKELLNASFSLCSEVAAVEETRKHEYTRNRTKIPRARISLAEHNGRDVAGDGMRAVEGLKQLEVICVANSSQVQPERLL
jgi:hypothetical protein